MSADYMAASWGAIDATFDPERFIGYLDSVGSLPTIQKIKGLMYDLLRIKPGDHILDIGCGLGDDARTMATVVGTNGLVVGVDRSKLLLTEAEVRSAGSNLRMIFQQGDAESLGFADHTFDGCRVERVLVHLSNPAKALVELARVSRLGARVVAFDLDWETVVVDAADRQLTRRLLNFQCDCAGSRWVGRQLRRHFIEAGLSEIQIHSETLVFTDFEQADFVFQLRDIAIQAQAVGAVSKEEAALWLDDLDRASRNGRFFAAATGFCVCGLKPPQSFDV